MKIIIAILIGAIVIAGGAYWYQYVIKAPAPTSNVNGPAGQENDQNRPPARRLTLTDVGTHATSTDCWLAINGKVYDVTQYIAGAKHPGGAAILTGCGKDATSLFETRPMGSKTPHSEKARGFLPNFYIGNLAQ